MKEIFKPIKNYEGLYEISNLGRVKSFERKVKVGYGAFRLKSETVLRLIMDKGGYLTVNLYGDGRQKSFKIHHLVWDNFRNRKRNGLILQIDHIDGNKKNNKIDNLQLLSLRENISKGFMQNGKKTSLYTGVCWLKKLKKWRAQIRIKGERKYLGCFKNEKTASQAYQKVLKKLIQEWPECN